MIPNPLLADDLADGEAESASAVSWAAVFAGAVVAMATSLIFVTLGAGFGFAALAPWPHGGAGLKAFTAMTGVWLIVTQWAASGVGGYVTGRLRTRWRSLHTHEVFFRDTANGLVMWALATVAVAALGALAATSGTTNEAAQTAATVAGGVSDNAVEIARKAAAAFSTFTAISMLVGAFIACVAAALGGQQRDEHP
jgi:hypothetical protein